jgi:hypothetical protein
MRNGSKKAKNTIDNTRKRDREEMGTKHSMLSVVNVCLISQYCSPFFDPECYYLLNFTRVELYIPMRNVLQIKYIFLLIVIDYKINSAQLVICL